MSADATQRIEYDPDTLKGLSDHVMVMTKMTLPQLQMISDRSENKTTPAKIFKWVEGTNVYNYAQSAHTWTEYTSKDEFKAKFKTLVENTTLSNDERAAQVEEFLLQEAISAGVVKEIKITVPKNPNKWGKTLAPWYTDTCRAAKRDMAWARREHGKGDERCKMATRAYFKTCSEARLEFAA
jgi:uncharacterized membrane protein